MNNNAKNNPISQYVEFVHDWEHNDSACNCVTSLKEPLFDCNSSAVQDDIISFCFLKNTKLLVVVVVEFTQLPKF